VVRKEGNEFRLYSHLGTGNYNSTTANIYTDVGLFTCNPAITSEVVDVFHFLTGRSLKSDYKMLLVSPMNMKDRFLELIRSEAANAQAGKPSGIVAKMNSLEDRDVIDALYGASKAGVPITLIVRGFCCLRAQVPQLSENIRVVSIVGPLLEHARLFFFRNSEPDPENGLFYLGSGDWMYRNLLSRVEVAAPVVEPTLKKRLWQILNLQMQDNRLAWDMAADGSYHRRLPKAGEAEVNSQLGFMEVARHRLTLASDPEAVNTTPEATSSRTTGKSSSTH
jgi:polyphosphate kinase